MYRYFPSGLSTTHDGWPVLIVPMTSCVRVHSTVTRSSLTK
ncbi:Uncharacterised protein [Mycobacterium tuberculosis]|nr:Uncharacterised protein [Mycobacterium tuberculosis]